MAPADAEAVIDKLFKYPRFFVDHMMGACFCLCAALPAARFWVDWGVGLWDDSSYKAGRDARPNSSPPPPPHTHSLRTPPPPLHHRPLHAARGRHRPLPARGGHRPPDPLPGKLAGGGGGLGVQVCVYVGCWCRPWVGSRDWRRTYLTQTHKHKHISQQPDGRPLCRLAGDWGAAAGGAGGGQGKKPYPVHGVTRPQVQHPPISTNPIPTLIHSPKTHQPTNQQGQLLQQPKGPTAATLLGLGAGVALLSLGLGKGLGAVL